MNTAPSFDTLRCSQRRSVRRAVRLECEVVRERDFKRIASHAVDVSPDGMLAVADVPVLTGEEVVVTFRPPRSWVWFDACGTVARVVHGRRPGDTGRCLGIQFNTTEATPRAILQRHLATVPPPLPRRPTRLDYVAMIAKAMR